MVSKNSGWRTEIPSELKAWVTNRMVRAHIRSINSLIPFLLINFVAILFASLGALGSVVIAGFAVILGLGIAQRHYLAKGMGKSKQRRDPENVAWWFEINSACLGLTTGVLLAIALPKLDPMGQLLLAVSGATQIAGIAFTTRTLRKAAFAHMCQMAAGLVVGCLQIGGAAALGLSILIIAATILQIGMINVADQLFIVRVLKERELHESSQTVRMLLNDFEEQGSDWLFELDGKGHMQRVSERFAAATGCKPEELNGVAFAALLAEGNGRDQYNDHIQSRHAFRNLLLEVTSNNDADTRWWSVSLRPIVIRDSLRFRGVISDVSAEKQAEERVRHLALYDSLTGLPNRMMFVDSLNRALKNIGKKNRSAVLFIDFDHFKVINDMYGHPMGDAFLRHVGDKLAEAIGSKQLGGEASLVARLGGDEFAILISCEDVLDRSVRLAQRLVDIFSEVCVVDGIEIGSGISVGIALAPNHSAISKQLMSYADMALYAAKSEGRGRWEMFAPGMDEEVHRRHGMARDLRTAVANGELRLFLQPLVDVESTQNVGFEALMRWEHPERGMVMPNDFIPIAEETGLIVPMGEWIIRAALHEAMGWHKPYGIAINLSPLQLKSPTLLPTIVNALATTGIDPGRVELEITETALLNDCESNIETLNRLHSLGLKIALDDFGTGYASLNYLLTFPFDKIKIDRSFVNDLESRSEAQAIVSSVISLANQLGMCTLAEGVEREDQLARLRDEGCEMVQGSLFGKAMPADYYAEIMQEAGEGRKAA